MFEKIFMTILMLMLCLCVYLAIKNEITFRGHLKVSELIFIHNNKCLREGMYDDFIGYSVIESYEKSLFIPWHYKPEHYVSADIWKKLMEAQDV